MFHLYLLRQSHMAYLLGSYFPSQILPQLTPNAYLLVRHRYSFWFRICWQKLVTYVNYIRCSFSFWSSNNSVLCQISFLPYLNLSLPSYWPLWPGLSNSILATTQYRQLFGWLKQWNLHFGVREVELLCRKESEY